MRDYTITSLRSDEYNCFAWAYGDSSRWFDPRIDLGYYWPLDHDYGHTITAVTELFRAIGYEECADGSREPGYEKVAIYAANDEPAHAAKQLENGRWSSKLGSLEDIEHLMAEELHCPDYGHVAVFMRRGEA